MCAMKQKEIVNKAHAVSMAYLLFPSPACVSPPISFVSFRVTDFAFIFLQQEIILALFFTIRKESAHHTPNDFHSTHPNRSTST